MATQAMWVHGNVVQLRWPGGKGDPIWGNHTDGHGMDGVHDFDPAAETNVEWSDVVGLRTEQGVMFRGRDRQTQRFYGYVPSPVWRDGVRAHLAMVGFLYTSDDTVVVTSARVFDAFSHLVDLPIESSGGPHQSLVENQTRFHLSPPQPEVNFGICIQFDVTFANEGTITFHAVGADFAV